MVGEAEPSPLYRLLVSHPPRNSILGWKEPVESGKFRPPDNEPRRARRLALPFEPLALSVSLAPAIWGRVVPLAAT